MPATIFGDRFRGRGVPAWHGIGDTFLDDEELTAVEAFSMAGLDYPILKLPLEYVHDGIRFAVEGKFAIVRGGTHDAEPELLEVVGKDFEPIDNMELAEILDASGITNLYKVETVGALGNGDTVFLALADKDGEFDIAGSPAQNYWTIYDGKSGKKALALMNTPVKVVCSNTLVMGIQQASVHVKISHSVTAKAQLEFWAGIAPQLKAAEAKTREIIGTLTRLEASDDDVTRILTAAYPRVEPKGLAQLKALPTLELDAAKREMVDRAVATNDRANILQWERLELAKGVFDNYPNVAEEKGNIGTLWGVYEAVCDVEDHREATSTRESVAESALVGHRAKAKERAMNEAVLIAAGR